MSIRRFSWFFLLQPPIYSMFVLAGEDRATEASDPSASALVSSWAG